MKAAFNIAALDAEAINADTLEEGNAARQSLIDLKCNVATAVPDDKLKAFILSAAVVSSHAREGLLDSAEASREFYAVAEANELHAKFGNAEVTAAIQKAEARMLPKTWQDSEEDATGGFRRSGSREEIERLAELSAIDYDRERQSSADALGVRVSVLDAAVKARRKTKGDPEESGGKLELPEIKPWPKPVNGETLLNEIAKEVRSYIVMGEEEANTVALWAVHTHGLDRLYISPRLAVTSPEKGCGKSTAKDVLEHLVCRPFSAEYTTPAVLYHVAEQCQPTFLLDEADAFLRDNEELRGILNLGYRRNGMVPRMMKNANGELECKQFRTWCATAFFLIGQLHVTLHDRSIIIPLRRRSPHEEIKQFDPEQTSRLDELASMAARWMHDNVEDIVRLRPEMPGLFNRVADNWRQLVRIAERAGGSWPEKARAAYRKATSGDERQSMKVMLLSDVWDLFNSEGVEVMRSQDICDHLARMEERIWPEFNRGKPINPRGLGKLLGEFQIVSENYRSPSGVNKGYRKARFADAVARYVAPKSPDSRYTATSLQPSAQTSFPDPLQNEACSGTETPDLSPNHGHCSGVADENPRGEAFEEIPL